jgi:hypothetical protein
VRFAAERTDGTVCITDHVKMPYIFVLFYTQANPHTFANTVEYDNPGGEFQRVRSFDRYRFGIERCASPDVDAYVLDHGEALPEPEGAFDITDFKWYRVAVKR